MFLKLVLSDVLLRIRLELWVLRKSTTKGKCLSHHMISEGTWYPHYITGDINTFVIPIRPIRKQKFIKPNVPQLLTDGIRVKLNFFSLPFWLQVTIWALSSPHHKILHSSLACHFSVLFHAPLKSNLLFETLHDPRHTSLWWNPEALTVCASNSLLCIYFLNFCLSKLKWNDSGETNWHVNLFAPKVNTLVSHKLVA